MKPTIDRIVDVEDEINAEGPDVPFDKYVRLSKTGPRSGRGEQGSLVIIFPEPPPEGAEIETSEQQLEAFGGVPRSFTPYTSFVHVSRGENQERNPGGAFVFPLGTLIFGRAAMRHAWLVGLLLAGCASTVQLPSNVKLVPPVGVSWELAAFSGRWQVIWDDTLDHILVVEEITDTRPP